MKPTYGREQDVREQSDKENRYSRGIRFQRKVEATTEWLDLNLSPT
jgi:hypothetical protein